MRWFCSYKFIVYPGIRLPSSGFVRNFINQSPGCFLQARSWTLTQPCSCRAPRSGASRMDSNHTLSRTQRGANCRLQAAARPYCPLQVRRGRLCKRPLSIRKPACLFQARCASFSLCVCSGCDSAGNWDRGPSHNLTLDWLDPAALQRHSSRREGSPRRLPLPGIRTLSSAVSSEWMHVPSPSVIAFDPTDLTDSLSPSSIPHRHRRHCLPSSWPIHRLESAIPTRSLPRIPGASPAIRRRAADQPVSPTRRTRACARFISHGNSDTNQPTHALEE